MPCFHRIKLQELQETGKLTELMMLQEEVKTYPFGAVWDEFCKMNGVRNVKRVV